MGGLTSRTNFRIIVGMKLNQETEEIMNLLKSIRWARIKHFKFDEVLRLTKRDGITISEYISTFGVNSGVKHKNQVPKA